MNQKYKPKNDGVIIEKKPTIKYEDGSFYVGEWVKNSENRHGRGIHIWEDNSKYTGQWANDMPNGQGKYE